MEKFSKINYVRPDYKEIKKKVSELLKKYEKASSYEEQKKITLEIEDIYKDLYDMEVVSSVRNTINTADEFYENEENYIRKESAGLTKIRRKQSELSINSKFRKEFDKEFGKLINYNTEQQLRLLDPAIIPEEIKEGNLGQKYSKTVATCSCDFRGEKCNFYGLLKHMQSTDREERKEAFEAWAKMYKSVSKKLDGYYDKLVELRVQQAKKLGFKSYTDMAYLGMQRYDYTQKDVEVFRKQVVEYIVPAADKLYKEQAKRLGVKKLKFYDEQLVFPEGNAVPEGTTKQLVKKASQMYHELSKETGEFFDFMTKYELFDLETKPNKHMGGYMTFLPKRMAPFIFSNFNGTSADVDVLTHEAGHAFQGYIGARTQPLMEMSSSTSEVNEIHSMSMEHFTYPWMELFFGKNADKYRYSHLTEALKVIPYLVAVDEFQHEVFKKPTMDAMGRRKVWKKLEKKYLPWRDYDGNEFLEGGGFWMQKQHIFLYPFYYIDYALAATCAFQFYIKSLKDREGAWKDYVELCKAGGSKGYFELLKLAHLKNPLKEGTLKKTVDDVVKQIGVLEKKLK
ncbi:MAG: M3 family oligoendopeptidase [Lachnospiraceae bacterium]|nr:M3 family oligoendopeptidase [Lachnospiraceae bacterium]